MTDVVNDDSIFAIRCRATIVVGVNVSPKSMKLALFELGHI